MSEMKAGLRTDLYQLNMVRSLIEQDRNPTGVMEFFYRKETTRPAIMCGVERVKEFLDNFVFDDVDVQFLEGHFSPSENNKFFNYLRGMRLKSKIHAVPDGSQVCGYLPLIQIEGPLSELLMLETPLLSILNHCIPIASYAANLRRKFPQLKLYEFGSRRIHDEAAIDAAYSAWVGGMDATSNVLAGLKYGLPVVGTMSHAWVMSFGEPQNEQLAFEKFLLQNDERAILLVDTYDITTGINNAIRASNATGVKLKGIRIDSGDLLSEAKKAREILNNNNFHETKILLSGDITIDFDLKGLTGCVDGLGIGTNLVCQEPYGIVAKLVEIEGQPVAKKSSSKTNWPYKKHVTQEIKLNEDKNTYVSVFHFHEPGESRFLSPTSVMSNSAVLRPIRKCDIIRIHSKTDLLPCSVKMSPRFYEKVHKFPTKKI